MMSNSRPFQVLVRQRRPSALVVMLSACGRVRSRARRLRRGGTGRPVCGAKEQDHRGELQAGQPVDGVGHQRHRAIRPFRGSRPTSATTSARRPVQGPDRLGRGIASISTGPGTTTAWAHDSSPPSGRRRRCRSGSRSAPIDWSVRQYDCGTWGVSASWPIPADAISGVYLARLVREDGSQSGGWTAAGRPACRPTNPGPHAYGALGQGKLQECAERAPRQPHRLHRAGRQQQGRRADADVGSDLDGLQHRSASATPITATRRRETEPGGRCARTRSASTVR